jgi:D-ribose pyranase
MKKIGVLNSRISKVISELGHTDQIVICDAGLPIPKSTERIDLALKPGVPSFIETVEVVLQEMQVEKAYIAKEIVEKNPKVKDQLETLLRGITIEWISHEEFKKMTNERAKAVIRTGECTPYANVILEAGVIF